MLFVVIRKKNIYLACLILLFLAAAYIAFHAFSTSQALNTDYEENSASNYVILIQIEEKRLYLFENGECIKTYPIASGKPGWPSPIGQWKIVEKGDWGEGFGGHWLGLNVLWGTYGIHGTLKENTIGRAASHGCIRMYNRDIKELYDKVPVGTPVIIRNGDYGPFGTGFRELKPGDRGADVLAIQQRLKELGYFSSKETGIYDDDMKKAIYRFQKSNNLKIKYTITYEDYRALGFSELE